MNDDIQKVYTILLEVNKNLGALNIQVSDIKENMKTKNDEVDKCLKEHDEQIGKLNDFKSDVKTRVAMIASFASLIIGAGWKILSMIKFPHQ